jgi:hypothetical protein
MKVKAASVGGLFHFDSSSSLQASWLAASREATNHPVVVPIIQPTDAFLILRGKHGNVGLQDFRNKLFQNLRN